MSAYFAARALLPDGWAHDVRLDVDPQGNLAAVTANASCEDCQILGGAVLPAMTNLHSHAFQRVMAGLAEVAGDPQDSFWTWRELMYRLVSRLTPDQVGIIARQLYIEMLKGGYTQVAEFHYLHHDRTGQPYSNDAEMACQLSDAAQQVGIGLTMLPVLYSYAGFGCQAPHEGQKRFIQTADDYLRQHHHIQQLLRDVPLQNTGICFHSLRAVSLQQMQQVLNACSTELPVHLHISEQQKEVDDCLAWSGQRPIAWLFDNQPPDSRWCLIHATHPDTHELAQLAASQAVVGLCPTTEANLGDGIFPADHYLQLAGRWGIGSDSHVSLNVVEELRWLEYGQRLRERHRNRLALPAQPVVGELIYQQALRGGAQACAVHCGQLKAGFRADWLVLDGDDPYLAAAEDSQLLNRWLFAGSVTQIKQVWVAGQARVCHGQHPLQQQVASEFHALLTTLAKEA
jgi:formimidoylglutamate deiminase